MQNKVTYISGEATVTLYATDVSGAPAGIIWTGTQTFHNSIRIAERWTKKHSRPSASRYQKHHALFGTYEIGLGRPWLMDYPAITDLPISRRPFVLDVVWLDQDLECWHRKTFYGVTIADRELEGRDIESGMEDGLRFDAEYVVTASGTSTIPAPSTTLPYIVRFVGATGTVDLYSHDPALGTWTELAAGLTTGRATITIPVADTLVEFSGVGSPSLTVNSTTLIVASIADTIPLQATLPRLEFLYGGRIVASLTTTTLHVYGVRDSGPVAGAGRFQFWGGGAPGSSIGLDGLDAEGIAA